MPTYMHTCTFCLQGSASGGAGRVGSVNTQVTTDLPGHL